MMVNDFYHVKLEQFIGETTCYCGLKRLSPSGSGRLATTMSSIEVSEGLLCVGKKLPEPAAPGRVECVGHDALDGDQVLLMMEIQQPQHHQSVDVEDASRLQSDTSTDMSSVAASNTAPDEPSTRPNTWLVWQRNERSTSTPLEFRPLSPTLTDCQGYRLLWLGSADDVQLRCYQLKDDSIESLHMTLEQLSSPVMSLSALNRNSEHESHLAVGCQDGTVKLVAYRVDTEQSVVHCNHSHGVIIDGPIMALHLYEAQSSVRVVVGSMCGYVCTLEGDNAALSWEDPKMVVDSLVDRTYDRGDSVLAVCGWGDLVALGTYSGECRAYILHKKKFRLLWKCHLMYSVHALAFDGLNLVVTTRRTIHLFERRRVYAATKAKLFLASLEPNVGPYDLIGNPANPLDDTHCSSVWHAEQARLNKDQS